MAAIVPRWKMDHGKIQGKTMKSWLEGALEGKVLKNEERRRNESCNGQLLCLIGTHIESIVICGPAGGTCA